MCNNPVNKNVNNGLGDRLVQIPCNNCLGCKLDRLAYWSARCNSEFIKSKSAFVTFTYDDYHLDYMDSSCMFPTLNRDHLHKYIDNLRHQVKGLTMPRGCRSDFAFFACGEYGDQFKRPHYHVLFFGLDYQYHKKLLESTWRNGMIKSLPVTNGGVRYVVDYMTKTISGDLAVETYDKKGLERPFYMCSRGLGSDFFFAHKDEISRTGCVKIGSRVVPVPLYYINKYFDMSSSSYISRKNKAVESYREVMRKAKKMGFSDYDSYVKYCREANEISMYKKLVNSGKQSLGVLGVENFLPKFDDSLVFQALNIN